MEDLIEITENYLKDRIYIVRRKKVMLDFDLAKIYGYTTKQFNQQVKRNIERFDEDFRFQLNISEFEHLILRSQFVTSRLNNNWGGSRYLPYAFTEEGIYMLMTVLKGELAVLQSKALIKTFKQMKDYIVEKKILFNDDELINLSLQTNRHTSRLNEYENRLNEVEKKMVIQNKLLEMMKTFTESNKSKDILILNGKSVEANLAYQNLYSMAKKSIYIIDNYVGLKTLVQLKNIENIDICIFSNNFNKTLHKEEVIDFKKEYPNVKIKFKPISNVIHDRYIIIDYNTKEEKLYHCGASAKDAGKKLSTIIEINDVEKYHNVFNELLNLEKSVV